MYNYREALRYFLSKTINNEYFVEIFPDSGIPLSTYPVRDWERDDVFDMPVNGIFFALRKKYFTAGDLLSDNLIR